MQPKHHYNLVRLDPRQREELLRRLEECAGDESSRLVHHNRRREPRWPFRADDVTVAIDHPGGGSSRFLVLARNLSSLGMAFIHGGFLHPTTRCGIQLTTIGGIPSVVTGRVVGCRHVQGTLHEVRVQFEQPIDPTHFLSLAQAVDQRRPDVLAALKGRMLLMAAAEADAMVLRRLLDATDVAVTRTTTLEQTLIAGSDDAYDVVLMDIPLCGGEGLEPIRRVRDAGIADALVVVTAETGHERLKAALGAGADEVLSKPFEPRDLYVLLSRILRPPTQARPQLNPDAKDGLNQMLLQFIDHAEKMGRQLEQALDQQNLDQVRAACLDLKGSAAGHGYSALSDTASELLKALDETMSMDSCLQQITGLSAMCRRLAHAGKTDTSGADGDRKVE